MSLGTELPTSLWTVVPSSSVPGILLGLLHIMMGAVFLFTKQHSSLRLQQTFSKNQ
jgi:hypothetical protein